LSPEHPPPTEDVPPTVTTHIETPPLDVPLPNVPPSVNTQVDTSLPGDTLSVNVQSKNSPLVDPLPDNTPSLVHEQTPVQEVYPRKSIWKTPKWKRG